MSYPMFYLTLLSVFPLAVVVTLLVGVATDARRGRHPSVTHDDPLMDFTGLSDYSAIAV